MIADYTRIRLRPSFIQRFPLDDYRLHQERVGWKTFILVGIMTCLSDNAALGADFKANVGQSWVDGDGLSRWFTWAFALGER
jgi:hypothetical protein